ncbi:MAG: TonB-dependent receptor [Bacteroidetes bacterium]|nr:TonB-dependent receptor [Bacteroidota bacterium]
MLRAVVILLFGLSFIGLKAQTVTLYDADKTDKLIGVLVACDSPRVAIVTDANGQFNLTPFRGGKAISISYLGYETQNLSFSQIVEKGYSIQMQPKSLLMKGMVISANRMPISAKEATQTIAVISNEDVELQNPQTAADLLGSSGSVFIQKSQQGGGSPMIRGFATNRVLIAVDGIRMNNAIFRSGNLQNVISIDPLSVQSTEVLFGPGSVMYGSDAIGGVMSFFTKEPKFSLNNEPLVTGGALVRFASANNEFTAHFNASIGLKKWGFYSSVSQNQFGHLRMGSKGPDAYLRPTFVQHINGFDVVATNNNPLLQNPTAYSQTSMVHKVVFKPNKHWKLKYALHHSATSKYDRYDRLIETRANNPRYGDWYYGPQIWNMNHLNASYHKNTVLLNHLSISVARQDFEESRLDRSFGSDVLRERVENVVAYSLNIDATKRLNNSNLYYGIENVINEVTSVGYRHLWNNAIVSTEQGLSRYPNAIWQSHAAYATWNKPMGKWLLQIGGRYNLFGIDALFDTTYYPLPFTETSFSKGAFSGSVGLDYKPTENTQFTLNLSSGFRSPNVDDMGKIFDSEPGSVVVPNTNISAENAYNVELVLKQVIAQKAVLQLVSYYTYLQNALVRRNYTLNGNDSIVYDGVLSQVQAIQNAAYAQVYGAQVQLKWQLAKSLRFTSTFNWQKGVEELDDGTLAPLRHAGPWYGQSSVSYTHHPVQFMLYSAYTGQIAFKDLPIEEQGKPHIYAIDTDGNPYSPNWATINMKVMVKVNQNWSISGGVENITDQRYKPYSSGIAAAGRNVVLSLNSRF